MIDNSVYYKLYIAKSGLVTVVCMQWFDEYDYTQSKFIKDSDDNHYKFSSEEEAIKKLNKLFNKNQIDKEYLVYL